MTISHGKPMIRTERFVLRHSYIHRTNWYRGTAAAEAPYLPADRESVMAKPEKEHAGSGIDKPAPKTIREKITDTIKGGFKPNESKELDQSLSEDSALDKTR